MAKVSNAGVHSRGIVNKKFNGIKLQLACEGKVYFKFSLPRYKQKSKPKT
jgi:hypothetical protein